jgi:enoyl-CoA hydratase/carnithine racemase
MEILIERAGGVMLIGLDRPHKKNAITRAMYQHMADALAEAETDPAVRAVLLHGSDAVFSAGNDLEDFMAGSSTASTASTAAQAPVLQFLARLSTAPKPVVAAVAGPAVGIGTTMLLHCDLVYAADNARFSLPFTSLGLCPEAASSLLLPRLVGYQRAAEKLLLGEAFEAHEAVAMGLVNRVLPVAELMGFALQQAHKLAALPAASLRITKALMKAADAGEIEARIATEAGHFGAMLQAPEAAEAFAAFFARRKADFSQFD